MVSCRCFCFVEVYGDHRDLHSFPTRRSSDLVLAGTKLVVEVKVDGLVLIKEPADQHLSALDSSSQPSPQGGEGAPKGADRSEEHTSELQSHVNLVCRLLLEKKKKHTINSIQY